MGKSKGNGDEAERELKAMQKAERKSQERETQRKSKELTDEALRLQREARERGDI